MTRYSQSHWGDGSSGEVVSFQLQLGKFNANKVAKVAPAYCVSWPLSSITILIIHRYSKLGFQSVPSMGALKTWAYCTVM